MDIFWNHTIQIQPVTGFYLQHIYLNEEILSVTKHKL